jgi:hypothetical protein
MYAAPGRDFAVRVPFLLGGRPVVADPGSVRYTVLGEGGAPITGLIDVGADVPAGSAAVVVTVPASANQTSLRVGSRGVLVSFTAAGAPSSTFVAYRLAAPPPVWVTPADVRGLLGAARDEIADADVDLVEAHLEVENALGASTLSAALASGARPAFLANRAVAHNAALRLLPSARARYAQSRTNGQEGFSRFRVDFDALEASLRQAYADALSLVAGSSDTLTSPVLMVLTKPTDVITGA